jgi:beta-phosphoglucomutase-like phosphatase (HAD superfamily)
VIEQWKALHRSTLNQDGSVCFGSGDLEAMNEYLTLKKQAVSSLMNILDSDGIADLEALFTLGYPGVFGESYERRLAEAKARQQSAVDPRQQVIELIENLSLLHRLQAASAKVGRVELPKKLLTHLEDVRPTQPVTSEDAQAEPPGPG